MKISRGKICEEGQRLSSVTFGSAFTLLRQPEGWMATAWNNEKDEVFMLTTGTSHVDYDLLKIVTVAGGRILHVNRAEKVLVHPDAEVFL